jgi:hypothetical protein
MKTTKKTISNKSVAISDLTKETDKRCPIWKKQRITEGIADIDLWNGDEHILGTILSVLYYHRNTYAGCPCGWHENVDKARIKWYKLLDEMMDGFTIQQKHLYDYIDHYTPEEIAKIKKSWKLLQKHLNSLWS